MFQFENFRVRKLKAINALNFYIALYGISRPYSYEIGNECTESSNHTDRRSGQRKKQHSAITDQQKVSLAYFRMQKKASGSGSGQSALHTVNFALSWLFEQINEHVSRSPVPARLMKVPLFIKLPLNNFSKIWQIGTLGDYIHFEITVCGNSRKINELKSLSFPLFQFIHLWYFLLFYCSLCFLIKRFIPNRKFF